jgi:hypothetical protein
MIKPLQGEIDELKEQKDLREKYILVLRSITHFTIMFPNFKKMTTMPYILQLSDKLNIFAFSSQKYH